jgi:hypothetical protein
MYFHLILFLIFNFDNFLLNNFKVARFMVL